MATHNQTQSLNAVTTTQNSSQVDCSTAQFVGVDAYIVQNGTATTAATITVQWSNDAGTTWVSGPTYMAGLPGVPTTYGFQVSAPPSANLYRVAFVQQAGGTSSTCSAWRATGLRSRCVAPASTSASSCSATWAGVPWTPEVSTPLGS